MSFKTEQKENPHPLMKKQWKLLVELMSKTEWDTDENIKTTVSEIQKTNKEINRMLKDKRDKPPNVKCSVDNCNYHDGRYCKVPFAVNIDKHGYCISKRIPKAKKER